MKFILGKKIEMTQIWKNDKLYPVTKIEAGPCFVLQVKNKEKDGYEAVQVGYGNRKSKNTNKPLTGHFKKIGYFSFLKEFRLDKKKNESFNVGDKFGINSFVVGDKLKIASYSKGKGFQGGVKRHGFHGQDATHGNKDQLRKSGSIGAGGVQRVFKGTKMAGRMGNDRTTLKDVEIIDIDFENNILFVKGAVAGHRNSLVMISAEGVMEVMKNNAEIKTVEAEVIEEKDNQIEEIIEEKNKEENIVSENNEENDKKEEVKEEK